MSIRRGSSIIAGNGGSGSGSAMNVDNITTELNASNEIQAIGTIEKNNSYPKYDWVGTYAEWSAGRVAGTIDDSWICYITDDDKKLSASKERTIGEIIFSLIPQNDPSLHLLDGALIDGTGAYNAFYTYMLNVFNGSNRHCFTTESDWQTSVSTYGVCGKFVLNTSNQTIRLPKVTGFIEGTNTGSAIGSVVSAGLPNITGAATPVINVSSSGETALSTASTVGALSYRETTTTNRLYFNSAGSTSNNMNVGLVFRASDSNSIYGNSDTVQPQAVKGFYYIVLSTSVNLDVPLDISALITQINNADYVIESQLPTSTNNYTWYRLYKSGWIEQGGKTTSRDETVTFPKAFADTNYTIVGNEIFDSPEAEYELSIVRTSTTQARLYCDYAGGSYSGNGACWIAKGMAEQS